MITPTSTTSSTPNTLAPASTQVTASGAVNASTNGPGTVNGAVKDTASASANTKFGKVDVTAVDQATGTATGTNGADVAIQDRINIRIVPKKNHVNVFVTDVTRANASANGPDASAAVGDSLAVNVVADPNVKVNLVVRERNILNAKANTDNRPAFLKYRDKEEAD